MKPAQYRPVSLEPFWNWPKRGGKGKWWGELAREVRGFPQGEQTSWGIPFELGSSEGPRTILLRDGTESVRIPIRGKASHLCVLHSWHQRPEDCRPNKPEEGLLVGEYGIEMCNGKTFSLPVRARFEVTMRESPGPPFLAMFFEMWQATDPVSPPEGRHWGQLQPGVDYSRGLPLVCAYEVPCPNELIKGIILKGNHSSPLLVSGMTLFRGTANPLQHLPRRLYRLGGVPAAYELEEVEVDLGGVSRIERTSGPRGNAWLRSKYVGVHQASEPDKGGEPLLEIYGARDATVTLRRKGKKREDRFSLGEAFAKGRSPEKGKGVRLEVLGGQRQWMNLEVRDASTGRPTPVRLHMSGSRGEYIAPYGHHAVVNTNWFEDYGADVVAGGRQYAYVSGEFTSDMPVGDVYVEIFKGFEYEPIRQKVTIRPGQKRLVLKIKRWKDLRSEGWVTADTHVHFISPQTAWLEGQCEGVNVVNLLASQWGRLFTNVGDLTGRVGVVEDDTIVYVGTENRNHMLGHMSMLGTRGLPVYPMCCGGPGESYLGDPDFMMLAEWARENKKKGGVVIRPHFPYCGFTEDPVPILAGLVDALEIGALRGDDFPVQEWYRYLNCGYKVAVAGGTDKMGAYCPLGWLRTYAHLDPNRPFTYRAWAKAVRQGKTFASNGPLLDLRVDGHPIGDELLMKRGGGTLEVAALAESFWPLGLLELVHDGRVVMTEKGGRSGKNRLEVYARVKVEKSGWIAARCSGAPSHPGGAVAAHTSPVYVKVGETRAFSAPAAEHMLGLVEGGMEYLQKLSTAFDEPSRKRMIKLFKEAKSELKGRILVEGIGHHHHHHTGNSLYHHHGYGENPGHRH